jgi:hypothetical protein
VNFETSWGFGIEEVIGDGNDIETGFSVNFDDLFQRDFPIAESSMDMEIAQ